MFRRLAALRLALFALALAALMLASAGCEPLPQDTLAADLQGTWSSCTSDGLVDRREVMTFAGSRIDSTTTTHATADGSCGGDGATESSFSGSYVAGEFLDARLGVAGADVLARGLDVKVGTRTFYTTVYVDAARTPRGLHVGQADASTGRDMTSGAKRPIVLASDPLLLQP